MILSKIFYWKMEISYRTVKLENGDVYVPIEDFNNLLSILHKIDRSMVVNDLDSMKKRNGKLEKENKHLTKRLNQLNKKETQKLKKLEADYFDILKRYHNLLKQ